MSKDCVRVLLVEDSPSDARLLRESLENYPFQKFEIELTERLDDAIALLTQRPFDVILLDLDLPDSRGMQTCERMFRAAGQTPIIVLTGADSEAIAAEAMCLGIQDYLVKGQTHGGVIGRTVRYAVERARSQQALREANQQLQEQAEELTTVNAALQGSEQRLHLAMDAGRVGVWEWQPGMEHVEWSQGIYTLLGYKAGEVTPTHESLRQRIHPQDLARQEQALRESMERCEDYFCEFRVVWTDGSVHWIEARGQYAYAEDRNGVTLWMRGVLSDIDLRKQAEEALRESELRHRRLIENLKGSHFIYVHDTKGVFTYLGESLTDVLGYTPDEFMAHYSQFMTDHPANQAVYRHTDLSIQGIRQPPYEVNVWHKDGSSRWLEVQEVPVLDAGGKVIAVEGVAQDITERKQAEEALRELTRTLESKVARRTAELEYRARQLQKLTLELSEAEDRERKRISEILHDDLQQILAAAKFHLNLVRNRVKYDASLQATVAQIDHMLKDAIDKSRALSHDLSPAVLHHGDFGDTLGWLAGQTQTKHGLLVHVDAFSEVHLKSDALRAFLYRAAQELLFNVVKHARVNEARIRIRRWGQCICLSVSDRGRGFDPQELKAATGFGLFSIRERVELLGGRMKIKSLTGRGSTFHIIVPDGELAQKGIAIEPAEYAKETKRAQGDGQRRLRVLIADDHEIVRQGLISLLSDDHSIQVVGEAANGREAVDQADRLRPDVVIMDVAMPLIDGDEATRQIKKHMPETRVIALSMYEEHENVEKMLQAGAETYILKTAPSEELIAAIRSRQTVET